MSLEASHHRIMQGDRGILAPGQFPERHLLEAIPRNQGLEAATSRAFGALGAHPSSAKVELYQAGTYSFVFLLTANQRRMIMQIGKNSVDLPEGAVVGSDGKNLTRIAQLAPGYTPAVYGTETIDICGVDRVPVLFTEYFDGYHELVEKGNRLRTNRPTETDQIFYGEEAADVFRSMVTIPIHIFAKMYDPASNTGPIVDDITIGAGDFVYRTFDSDADPLTRLITARELGDGSPAQLLRMVSSLASYQLGLRGGHIHQEQYQRHVERTDALLEEVGTHVLQAVFPSSAEQIWGRWSESYASESEKGLRDVLRSLPDQTSYADLPPGYRSVVRDKLEDVYWSLRILGRDDCEDMSALRHGEKDVALRIAQQVPYSDLLHLFSDPNPMREAKIAFRKPFEELVGKIEPWAFEHSINRV